MHKSEVKKRSHERAEQAETPIPLKLLIIDDEAVILETLALGFSMTSEFEVLTLSEVTLWRETIESFRPDVILVDYRMPTMMGDAFIQALNISGLRTSIPILVVGLYSATPFTTAQVQKLGADVFFSKPFSFQHILTTLQDLTLGHRSTDAA